MALLVGIVVFLAAAVGLAWGLVEFGHFLDKKEDDPKFAVMRTTLGPWLASQEKRSFPARVRQANETFFHWFDALFRGNGTLLEQGLWLGLLFSPIMLVLIRLLLFVTGTAMPQTSAMLLLAIELAFSLSIAALVGKAFRALAQRLGGTVGRLLFSGVLGGIHFRRLGGAFFTLLSITLFGVLGSTVGSVDGGRFFGPLTVVFFGVFGATLGAVLGGVLQAMLDIAHVSALSQGLSLGLSYWFGGALSVVALQFLSSHFPVHPLRSIASSLVAISLLGAIRPSATASFYHLLLQDGPILLTYVAFNIFADGLSLLETRWVLRRSLNLRLLALPALVVLDLALSAGIFLVLPLFLGELPSFWESIFFRGSRPWLGILFWSTFSTSALFYLFVGTVVFLVLPGHGLARLFHRIVGRFTTIEFHPFTAIAFGMILVLVAVAVLGSAGTFLYNLAAG